MDNTADLSLKLLKCVKYKDLEGVRRFLFRGANPNFPAHPGGISAMHFAAGTNFHEAAHLLLLSGGNPNIRSFEGLTPVLISAAWGSEEVFRLLLLHGGNPSLQDKDGNNALDLALENNQQQIVLLIHKRVSAADKASDSSDSDSGSSEYFTVDEFLCIDSDSNVAFVEQFSAPSLKDSSSGSLDSMISLADSDLRSELKRLGENPGPITETTRRIYVGQLRKLRRRAGDTPKSSPVPLKYSKSLSDAIVGEVDPARWKQLEARFLTEFSCDQKWRGGTVRASFIYFLMDPRVSRNLTLRFAESTPPPMNSSTFREAFATFVKAIFYVGKGQMHRAYDHFCEALNAKKAVRKRREICSKVARILDIWEDGCGVISLHCFRGLVQAEAFTREACVIDAIGLSNLTNVRSGQYYGSIAGWSARDKTRIGCLLLIRAFNILLQEGERQIHPINVKQT